MIKLDKDGSTKNNTGVSKIDPNMQYLDLGYIGNKVASFITKQTKHKIEAKDIMITHLSGNADAICYCQKQYNFYVKKYKNPARTPLYMYIGETKEVVKMGQGKMLGNLDLIVNDLEKQGVIFKPIKSLLVN